MHIALTVGSFDLTGGIERVTVALALGYAALGHEVTVFAADWDPAYEDRFRFERVEAPRKPAWLHTLTLSSRTAQKLAGTTYDFVHGQGTSTLTCDLLTYHTVHAAWLDVSVAADGTWSPRGMAKRLYPFHRAAIAVEKHQARSHTGRFHTCSRAVREEAIHYYGVPPERVAAIPWGIDQELFRPDTADRARTRDQWGVGADTPVLLMVANEYHRKGLGTLLEAVAALGRKDLRLMVAGRASHAGYLAQVERLGLRQQVTFLGHHPPAALYRAADLFVMPTSYEGWSLVIGEALASGLPVVTSRFAGSSDMLEDGRNGFVLDDPRDVGALSAALERALQPATLATMSAGARPSVASYTWNEVAEKLLAWGTG